MGELWVGMGWGERCLEVGVVGNKRIFENEEGGMSGGEVEVEDGEGVRGLRVENVGKGIVEKNYMKRDK